MTEAGDSQNCGNQTGGKRDNQPERIQLKQHPDRKTAERYRKKHTQEQTGKPDKIAKQPSQHGCPGLSYTIGSETEKQAVRESCLARGVKEEEMNWAEA